ncbi:hypothetical protein ACFL3V_07285 [Nanoarchaeota archaeon]
MDEEEVPPNTECEEPNCRYRAVRDFHGKNLCQDCWERYKAAEDKMNMEIRDMG